MCGFRILKDRDGALGEEPNEFEDSVLEVSTTGPFERYEQSLPVIDDVGHPGPGTTEVEVVD